MDRGLLAETKAIIKSLIISSPHGISVDQLNRDYRGMEGRNIPYGQLGYTNLNSFLFSLKDTIMIHGSQVLAVSSEKTQHIDRMISNQKNASRIRRTVPVELVKPIINNQQNRNSETRHNQPLQQHYNKPQTQYQPMPQQQYVQHQNIQMRRPSSTPLLSTPPLMAHAPQFSYIHQPYAINNFNNHPLVCMQRQINQHPAFNFQPSFQQQHILSNLNIPSIMQHHQHIHTHNSNFNRISPVASQSYKNVETKPPEKNTGILPENGTCNFKELSKNEPDKETRISTPDPEPTPEPKENNVEWQETLNPAEWEEAFEKKQNNDNNKINGHREEPIFERCNYGNDDLEPPKEHNNLSNGTISKLSSDFSPKETNSKETTTDSQEASLVRANRKRTINGTRSTYSSIQNRSADSDEAVPVLDENDLVFQLDIPEDVVPFGTSLPPSVIPEEIIANDYFGIFVTEIHNPYKFWFHFYRENNELDLLMQDMENYYTSIPQTELTLHVSSLRPKQVCAALFINMWHRAEIISEPQKGKIKVFFVDYGTVAEVDVKFVKYLQNTFAKVPIQAFRGCLSCIRPMRERWDREATYAFLEMVSDLLLYAKTTEIDRGQKIFYMILTDTNSEDDYQINDALIRRKLAKLTNKEIVSNPKSRTLETTVGSSENEEKITEILNPSNLRRARHFQEIYPSFQMIESGEFPSFTELGSLLVKGIDYEAHLDTNITPELDADGIDILEITTLNREISNIKLDEKKIMDETYHTDEENDHYFNSTEDDNDSTADVADFNDFKKINGDLKHTSSSLEEETKKLNKNYNIKQEKTSRLNPFAPAFSTNPFVKHITCDNSINQHEQVDNYNVIDNNSRSQSLHDDDMIDYNSNYLPTIKIPNPYESSSHSSSYYSDSIIPFNNQLSNYPFINNISYNDDNNSLNLLPYHQNIENPISNDIEQQRRTTPRAPPGYENFVPCPDRRNLL